ncbi:MAG: hypothetical protein DIZ80_05050 [endosymbiont of Galathealinum brachiosum]|uniref:PLD phosphodiesterase domain-containing protein n=1 Tax=endosymbiont of Galathealinum brachiosum TaxID=2200906 RepID=A0A370DJ08_9GAMM|nr:MAG: hypothetical protein DIZ80_05050 [endosymbiont of Galathealinum brachiosum]
MKETNSETQNTLLSQLHCWSSEEIYFTGDNYFNDLISSLNNAKHSIEFECYIFYQDDLGRRVITALIDAAKRGINIRVIIDGYGSLNWNTQQLSELTDLNIEIKIFHPLPWRLSLYKKSIKTKNFINKFLYLSSRINKRDHRKLYIIDDTVAWSGSMNISSSHTSQNLPDKTWLDCGVKVSGESVLELTDNFNEIWKRKIRYTNENRHLPFRTNNNIIRRQHKNNELIQLIQSCNKKIWIISAYFAPSKHIVDALKQARAKGADVKLIISHHSDVVFFPLISTTYYTELLKSGIEIYEHNEYIIHAKTILLDDIAFVGSSNLNHRSFLHDLELDIILTKTDTLEKLKNKFIQLIKGSDKITQSRLVNLPWYYRILGKIIWRIRYWL